MILRALMLSCILLAACTSSQPVGETDEAPEVTIVWPSPPETARIRFLRDFGSPEDLGIRPSAFRRLMDAVAGAKATGMIRPYAVSVHEQRILVADPGMHAIHLFDRARRSYRLISMAGDESLSSPVGVALGKNQLFVADSALGKVFILDDKGDLLATISSLQRPTGLAFDIGSGHLYVADTLAHRIIVFDQEGQQLFEFGKRGIADGEFNFPAIFSCPEAVCWSMTI